MALAKLFAKTATSAENVYDPFKDLDMTEETPHPVQNRTLAIKNPNSYRSAISKLPKKYRLALEQAQTTRSMSHFANKSNGPLHFKLAKAGTKRIFNVHLGNPVVADAEVSIPSLPGKPVDEATLLFLAYYVLVRILFVPLDDNAIMQVPNLEPPTLEPLP